MVRVMQRSGVLQRTQVSIFITAEYKWYKKPKLVNIRYEEQDRRLILQEKL